MHRAMQASVQKLVFISRYLVVALAICKP